MALSKDVIRGLQDQLVHYDYIRFTWSDFHGIARGKTVPTQQARGAIEDGVGCFAGNAAFGPRSELPEIPAIIDVNYCNITARAVTSDIMALPWAGGNKYRVGELLCQPTWNDGTMQKATPRFVATRQLDRLHCMGYELMSACEEEFILCKDGEILFKGTEYCSHLRFSEIEDIMFDIDQNMRQIGIESETLEVEFSPGQVEFAFKPAYGITTADSMFRFKCGVKEMMKQRGLTAVFMSKPFMDKQTATGTHFNHSLWSKTTGRNVFYDAEEEDHISKLTKYWIGGIMKHMDAITAICCPTVNCYRRLHTQWAADKKDWDFDNRLVSLRLKSQGEKGTYLENRIPSGAANVYLVTAVTLAAGIDGIKNEIEPPPMGRGEDTVDLPHSLEEALDALEQDTVLWESLGQEFVEWYLAEKRQVEVKKFKSHDVKASIEEELELEREEYFELM